MSSTSETSQRRIRDIARDIVLWRNRKASLMFLLGATATWVLLEVYQFNFVTVVSWLAMVVLTALFLWGSMTRLLEKEPPRISGLEISEESAMRSANSARRLVEEGIQRIFRVTAEENVFVFAGVVVALLLLSYVGSSTDFLTLTYIGTLMGMSVPVLYVKYEENIIRYGEMVKVRVRRFYDMMDEKVVKKMKKKVVKENKDKKVE